MTRPLRIEYENAFYHVMNRAGEDRLSFIQKIIIKLFSSA